VTLRCHTRDVHQGRRDGHDTGSGLSLSGQRLLEKGHGEKHRPGRRHGHQKSPSKSLSGPSRCLRGTSGNSVLAGDPLQHRGGSFRSSVRSSAHHNPPPGDSARTTFVGQKRRWDVQYNLQSPNLDALKRVVALAAVKVSDQTPVEANVGIGHHDPHRRPFSDF
jgi:hypothetical protein